MSDAAAGRGDDEWLAGLFDAHAPAVRRYLRRRLTDAASPDADADDLTAEVFAIAWRRRDEVPDPALPWLYGVARRVVAGHRRRVVALPVAQVESEIDLADPAVLVTDDEVLRSAWSGLSARDREVLLLVAWEGLSERDLAAALGVTTGGASAALARARSRLREALAKSD